MIDVLIDAFRERQEPTKDGLEAEERLGHPHTTTGDSLVLNTKNSEQAMAERPTHIPLPPNTGLRSALRQPQTPATATGTSSMTSSPLQSPSIFAASPSATSDGGYMPMFSGPMTSSSTSMTVGGTYHHKVSFDTFENPAAQMFSYTIPVKSEGWSRSRNTRVFLVAASPDESGVQALDWAMESLIQDGDELIVFRGFDTEELDKDHDVLREEARDLLRQVQRQNTEYDPDRKLSIIIEFIAGKVTETIERLIALYRPDSLVVGTRGQRTVKLLGISAVGGMGSVSRYCLSNSPVPVIVVRPERKRSKAVMKRRANPKRGTHFEEKPPLLTPSSTVSSMMPRSPPGLSPVSTRQ